MRNSPSASSARPATRIGRHVGFGIDPDTKIDMEIVGVIKDIKYTSLRDEIPIQMFEPYLAERYVRRHDRVCAHHAWTPINFFQRCAPKFGAWTPICRSMRMRTMEEQISNSLLVERLIASLSTVFGFLATLLAIIGLVWGDGVHGGAPHARNRDPHGAGRFSEARDLDGDAGSAGAGCHRDRGRVGGRIRV